MAILIGAAIGLIATGISAVSQSETARKTRDASALQQLKDIKAQRDYGGQALQAELQEQSRENLQNAAATVAAATIGANAAERAARQADQSRQATIVFAFSGLAITAVVIVILLKKE